MSVVSPNPSGLPLNTHLMEIPKTDSMPELEPKENSENQIKAMRKTAEVETYRVMEVEVRIKMVKIISVRANQLISLTIAAGVMSTRNLHHHTDKPHIDADEKFVETLVKKADGYFLTIYANIIAGTTNPTSSKANTFGGSKYKQKNEFRPGAIEPEETDTSTFSRLLEGSSDSNSNISTNIPKDIIVPTDNQNSAYCHGGENPLKCKYCGLECRWKSRYDRHLLTHTGEMPFRCEKCGKGFNRQHRLKEQMMTHTGEGAFPCNQCEKRFSIKWSLVMHLKMQHSGDPTFPCPQCGKNYKSKSNLVQHMKIHSGDRRFLCNRCGKRFGRKWTLDEHLRIHAGERPYACDQCPKRFSFKSGIHRHLKIHAERRNKEGKANVAAVTP
ncbi:unnamed protein product [Orchesella dallaii]|uniref:C2H2-type domain-containing protein n=1 Tax=Orchesella dallaii TaxID=48710 RepID=A0ABP1PT39_9HEXA